MSAEAHILLSGHRLLIIVLQEYLGIVCRFCDQKITMNCTYYVVCYTGCSLNLMVVHSLYLAGTQAAPRKQVATA